MIWFLVVTGSSSAVVDKTWCSMFFRRYHSCCLLWFQAVVASTTARDELWIPYKSLCIRFPRAKLDSLCSFSNRSIRDSRLWILWRTSSVNASQYTPWLFIGHYQECHQLVSLSRARRSNRRTRERTEQCQSTWPQARNSKETLSATSSRATIRSRSLPKSEEQPVVERMFSLYQTDFFALLRSVLYYHFQHLHWKHQQQQH